MCFSADTLPCTSFTPAEIQYCFEHFLLFSSRRPRCFSLFPSLLPPLRCLSLSLFGSIEVFFSHFEVMYLVCRSVSPAAVRSEGCLSVVPFLSLSHTHKHSQRHTLSLVLTFLYLSLPFLGVCRGGGRRGIPGCGSVGRQASSPTAEPHARGADQPPGAPPTAFLSNICIYSRGSQM